jgi:hypothetical protein
MALLYYEADEHRFFGVSLQLMNSLPVAPSEYMNIFKCIKKLNVLL